MAGPQLNVTDKTSIKELHEFAGKVGGEDKIRGKKNSDGSVTLYASTKKGTGLKNYLFGTTAKRRTNAQGAITQILFANTKRTDRLPGTQQSSIDDLLTQAHMSLPTGGAELSGKTLKAIGDIAQQAIDENFKPQGMQVSDRGVVTGQTPLTQAINPKTVQSESLQSLLKLTAEENGGLHVDKEGKPKLCGGQLVTEKAHGDIVRMHVKIQGYDTFGPPGGDGNPDFEKKREDNFKKLREFSGSDKATTVLSKAINQYMLRRLETSLYTSSGDEMKMNLCNKGAEKPWIYKDSNGVSHTIDPKQYAGCKYSLDKYPDGDFKLSIDWDLYVTGFRTPGMEVGMNSRLSPHDDRALKTNFKVELRIDKNEADKGNLVLTMPQSGTASFDGHLY